MPQDSLTVAVYMITYNHAAYIEKAIESVMMQQATFGYKLFIGDDCSSDGTADICRSLQAKYPNQIELTLNEKNIGGTLNAKQIFEQCFSSDAKYIALIEGDDFWIDPLKLQKQVDFLDMHPQCFFNFHKAYRIVGDAMKTDDVYPKNISKTIIDETDFFNIPTIPTASVLFRNQIKLTGLKHSHGDFLLYCTFLSQGLGSYLDEIMSVYRLHPKGISSLYGENWYLERRIGELYIEANFPQFSKKVVHEINKVQVEHVLHYLNKNRGQLTWRQKSHYMKKLFQAGFLSRVSRKDFLRLCKTLLK